MAVYMVERTGPGLNPDQIAEMQASLIEASALLTRAGHPVSYLRALWSPEIARCLCLFEADDAQLVELVHAVAQLPRVRAVEVVDLPAWYTVAADAPTPIRVLNSRDEAIARAVATAA